MKNRKLTGYLLIVLGVYLLIFFFLPGKKDSQTEQTTQNSIVLTPTKNKFQLGDSIKIRVENKTPNPIKITSNCPFTPFEIYYNGQAQKTETTYPCEENIPEIAPSKNAIVSLDSWNNTVFQNMGQYRVAYTTIDGENSQTLAETSFSIAEASWFTKTWDMLFYRPVYNTLIFLIEKMPGYNLGLAIILLTILIRIILLIPNQKALEQQKKMNKLQPKLQEVQEKYKGNQQKIGEETMKLWKEHKVNPMGSCLPMLLQLPILIALYYSIMHGLELGSTYFLYEPLKNFNITQINSDFLGIFDLSKTNITFFPWFLAILQFYQMKLALGKRQKETDKSKEIAKKEGPALDPMKMMNKYMLYFFPVIIAVTSIGFPSGVALYWGTSTIFGILQQLWVNKTIK